MKMGKHSQSDTSLTTPVSDIGKRVTQSTKNVQLQVDAPAFPKGGLERSTAISKIRNKLLQLMEQSWMAFSIQDCFLFQSETTLATKKPTNPRNGDRTVNL